MSATLRQFINRSPRYVLRTRDDKVMRFSLEDASHHKGPIQETLMVDLSESGVSFIVDAGSHPHMGDRVKVEVPIPNGNQIAWWATVVRLETIVPKRRFSNNDDFFQDQKVRVGLRFETLPEGHSKAIRRGLQDSFLQIMREQRMRNLQYYKTLAKRFAMTIFYVALAILVFGFVYWLAQPDANYDAQRGSPWGQRFRF